MAFYPGQKVVCVDATWRVPDGPLVEGRVYTVDGVTSQPSIYCGASKSAGFSLRLVEVPRWRGHDYRSDRFDASRFRPLTERSTETGMAILRKIADGQPVQEGVG